MRLLSALLLPLFAAGLLWAVLGAGRNPESADRFLVVAGTFEKWTPLLGRLEAADPVRMRAELDGLSKLIELAGDGEPVEADEVVARFDPSELEERKLTLTRDLDVARATRRALVDAEQPLELQQLEQEQRIVESEIRNQVLLRRETEALVNEDLLSAGELEVHDQTLSGLRAKRDALITRLDLTRRVLHPAAAEAADARVEAARLALERVEIRLAATEVRAPIAGTVHLPLIPIDGEQRPARVGDGLYRNQVYLQLSDLTDLVVRAEIGETFLSAVVPGLEAVVRFPAFPGRVIRARVARVGAYPRGADRRYPVELVLETSPQDLRPGLTAEVQVLRDRREDALVVPREFLSFSSDGVFARTGSRRVAVETGPGNPDGLLVLSGLEPGMVLDRP